MESNLSRNRLKDGNHGAHHHHHQLNKVLPRVVVMEGSSGQQQRLTLPLPDYDRDEESGPLEMIIKPKKLVNPVKESKQRMNIHKELLFNQKMGVCVLNKKTDLEKTIAKIKAKHVVVDPGVDPNLLPPSEEFAKVLSERKKRIENLHDNKSDEQPAENEEEDEFRKVHRKIFK